MIGDIAERFQILRLIFDFGAEQDNISLMQLSLSICACQIDQATREK